MPQVFCANEKPIKLCHNWQSQNSIIHVTSHLPASTLQQAFPHSHTNRFPNTWDLFVYLQNSRHCDLLTELGKPRATRKRIQAEYCHIFNSIFHRYTLILWRLCSNAHVYSSFPFWRMSTMSSLSPSSVAHSSGDLKFIHLAPPWAQRYSPESLTNESGLNNMSCFFGQG